MRYIWQTRGKLLPLLQKRLPIALFLDFDGTLVKIISNPENVYLPKQTKKILATLSSQVRLAIVTGRSLTDIKNRIKLEKVSYVACHGLEYQIGKIHKVYKISSKSKRALGAAKSKLEQLKNLFQRLVIEDKGRTISVHYRRLSSFEQIRFKNSFFRAISPHIKNHLFLLPGKKVFELLPKNHPTKGQAVRILLQRFAGRGQGNIWPIYVGDDTTDEDAFRALSGTGLTIRVGYAKRSAARYYLKNFADVQKFLRFISVARKDN